MSQNETGPDLGDLLDDVIEEEKPVADKKPKRPRKKKEKEPGPEMEREIRNSLGKNIGTEKCFEISVPDKARDEDLDYVPVGVNGELYQLKRGSTVILPERFLVALDHAQVPVYKKDPEFDDRKVVSSISKVPYRKIRQASWDEFEELKQSGSLSKK